MSTQSGFTPLTQAAQQMHELYLAWLDAGFTADEALKLLAFVVAQQPQSPVDGGS